MKERHRSSRRFKRYRSLRKCWLIIAFVSSFLGVSVWFFQEVANPKAANIWFESKITQNKTISLPKDDAPHGYKMEWWYYNGNLVTASGKKYSFHDTTFLVNNVMATMVNHVSLSDYQINKHYIDQRSSVGSLSTWPANHFDLISGDWRMSGGNGIDKLQISSSKFSFNLQLISKQEPIFHGEDGIIFLGSEGSSYYYSRTRMDISGTIKINGNTESVNGIAWFDHQWGDFLVSQLSWDWFSIQMDDNSDIMIYQFRNKSNETINYTGSFTKNGNTEILTNKDFSLSQSKQWVSNKTGISYPIEWILKIPGKNINVTIQSILNDSEFDSTLTTYNIYWEGAVQVTGTHTGKGFMELNGYKKNKN